MANRATPCYIRRISSRASDSVHWSYPLDPSDPGLCHVGHCRHVVLAGLACSEGRVRRLKRVRLARSRPHEPPASRGRAPLLQPLRAFRGARPRQARSGARDGQARSANVRQSVRHVSDKNEQNQRFDRTRAPCIRLRRCRREPLEAASHAGFRSVGR